MNLQIVELDIDSGSKRDESVDSNPPGRMEQKSGSSAEKVAGESPTTEKVGGGTAVVNVPVEDTQVIQAITVPGEDTPVANVDVVTVPPGDDTQVVNVEPAAAGEDTQAVNLPSLPDERGDEAVTVELPSRTSASEANGDVADEAKENEDVGCGLLVDRINTLPYQKAIERREVPFCAFAPISTQDLYLLKLQDCSDSTRHMLVPASREDVFNTPGALKNMNEEQEPGSEDSMNYRVAIVAIARQVYREELKQFDVIVDPLLKKDKKKIAGVKFLTLHKFADFVFLGFDGNVSEFANKGESNGSKDAGKTSSEQHQTKQLTAEDTRLTSPPLLPSKEKTPPRAPARRGRGGRRRLSRQSPPMPSTSSGPSRRAQRRQQPQHPLTMPPPPPPIFANCFQTFAPFGMAHHHDLSTEFTPTFIKMEPGDGQVPQYFTQVPIQLPHSMTQVAQLAHMPDSGMFTHRDGFTVPLEMSSMQMEADIHVPMPFNEVTVSSTDLGSDGDVQEANHDILTIAFDQLVSMTGGGLYHGGHEGLGDKKEGRRPGRKPRRKPLKERNPNEDHNTSTSDQSHPPNGEGSTVPGPKRRGRPPKNRPPIIISGQENEICDNSNPVVEAGEEVEKYSKCANFQNMEVQDENAQM